MKQILIKSKKYGNKLIQVDDHNYEYLIKFKWHINKNDYAVAHKDNTTIRMHRLIMNLENDEIIDHIDRNKLNNLENNLRKCTHSQNSCNKKSHGISKYLGVSQKKGRQKWDVYIQINNKNKFMGSFISEKDAALSYNKKAIEIHGEFANLNIID